MLALYESDQYGHLGSLCSLWPVKLRLKIIITNYKKIVSIRFNLRFLIEAFVQRLQTLFDLILAIFYLTFLTDFKTF